MLSRVNATAIHKGVTIRVGGEETRSGDLSSPLPLRVGENRILVTCTSSNRLTTRTYVLTVYVLLESLSGASLSLLTSDKGQSPRHRPRAQLRSLPSKQVLFRLRTPTHLVASKYRLRTPEAPSFSA